MSFLTMINDKKELTCTALVKEIQHRLSEFHGRRVLDGHYSATEVEE